MSGVFDPAQNITIEATDDPALAAAHGLTEWDAERGQYVAPAAGADEGDESGEGEEGLYPLSVLVGESGPEVTTPEGGEVAAPVTEGHEGE